LAKITKYLVYSILIIYALSNKVYSIESAAHKVEVAKCYGILMTIKNNSLDSKITFKSDQIFNLYFEKIIRLNIGSLMMKEMSEFGANTIYEDVINLNTVNVNKAIQKCISLFKIG
jgi:hypothetical protein